MLHEQSDVPGWIVMPDEVEARILEWQARHPDIIRVETERQYCGLNVNAVSVTGGGDGAEKKKMFVQVPHAHEPGATAGCMDFLNAVITGRHLDGRPFELDRERVLREILITVVPDANPDGRSRAPVRYWDGSLYGIEEFLLFMRGKDRHSGKMWARFDLWSTKDEPDHPDPVGIVYEQVSEHEYAEPNRTFRSSLLKLFNRHMDMHPYDLLLSLHQTDFVGLPANAWAVMPPIQDELPPALQAANRAVCDRIEAAWREAGATDVKPPAPLGYTGEQREYFLTTWGAAYRRMVVVISEVENNQPRTPPVQQMRLCEAPIRAAVGYLLERKDTAR